MSEPIGFISTHKIKEGTLDELTEFYQEGTKTFEEEKPGTVASSRTSPRMKPS